MEVDIFIKNTSLVILAAVEKRFFVGIIYGGAFLRILFMMNFGDLFKISIDGWRPKVSYYANGAVLTFLIQVQEMKVTKPDGYSKKYADNMLKEYRKEDDEKEQVKPSVLIIMNESFSDLSVLGDFESSEYLLNWNEITDYIMRGNVYVSVYGGGTCNSEFEFLTGNTMANLPDSVYPYQTYNLEHVSNVASIFKENNYQTIAMHPSSRYNWSRDKIYKQFGFSSFLGIEDFKDASYFKDFVSDKSNYDKIIEELNKSEEATFLFNITMQNHGIRIYI